MQKLVIFSVLLLSLAIGVASAASIFRTDEVEDFCFGYAICE
jgi:hypothetical protein